MFSKYITTANIQITNRINNKKAYIYCLHNNIYFKRTLRAKDNSTTVS